MPDQSFTGDGTYEAYILRLTWSQTNGRSQCRVSLQDADGDQRRSFATVADMCRFLMSRADAVAQFGYSEDDHAEGQGHP